MRNLKLQLGCVSVCVCGLQCVLREALEEMNQFFSVNSSCRLPLNPALHVKGINIQVLAHLLTCRLHCEHTQVTVGCVCASPLFPLLKLCSFFNSNAVPLKLSFQNVDPLGDHISVIFKVRFSASQVSWNQVFQL